MSGYELLNWLFAINNFTQLSFGSRRQVNHSVRTLIKHQDFTWQQGHLVQVSVEVSLDEVDAAVVAESPELRVNDDFLGAVPVSLPVSHFLGLFQVSPVAACAEDEADGAVVVVVHALHQGAGGVVQNGNLGKKGVLVCPSYYSMYNI